MSKERMQSAFQEYCASFSIVHQTTCTHTLQQKCVTELKNHHLFDVARSIKIHMHVTKYFWSDALLSACYLINCVPSFVLHVENHFLLFTKMKPCLNLYQVFLVVCVLCTCQKQDMMSQGCQVVFLGYSCTQKGYWCQNPLIKKYMTWVDVTFFKNTPYFLPLLILQLLLVLSLFPYLYRLILISQLNWP